MVGLIDFDEFDGHPTFLRASDEPTALLDRDQPVGIAVEGQNGRSSGKYVSDRARKTRSLTRPEHRGLTSLEGEARTTTGC